MLSERQTDLFLLFWVISAIVWDLCVLWLYGSPATISRRVLYWALYWEPNRYLLVLVLGVLLGHWFWPQPR